MNVDPTCDAYLLLKCRCCSNQDIYLVPLADARAVEAAFMDQTPVLTFQCADGDGVLRTMTVTREDFRGVQVAPLTEHELREIRRKKATAPALPAPALKLSAMLPGSGLTMNTAKIGGGK